MAGLDGIQKKLDPRKLGYGPIDQNIFTWTDEQRKSIRPLPGSLREALDALERDSEFLLKGDVFDQGQLEEWIKVKREEYYNVRNRPHPFEVAMYFDV
jgi:glutamine synthetase